MTRRQALIELAALGVTMGAAGHAYSSAVSDARAAAYRTPYKLNRLVLAKSGAPGSFDANLVDCPFVFSADGRFYMLHLGHDGTGYQTGLAQSDDLVNWRKLGMILGRDPNSKYLRYNASLSSILRDDDLSSVAPLRKVNGRYLGTWHAYPNAGYEQGAAVIGLAWSEDLRHWEVGEPVLRPEEGAAWERGGLYKSYLLEADGTYYLFYNAKNQTAGDWFEQIGVATSRDLKNWTRYPGNPIVPNGPKGSWDERFASDPAVVRKDKTWVLYYFGLARDVRARDLLALGSDPFHLTKVNEIMVDVGPPGSIDNTFAHKPGVISWRGDLYHFYCAVSGGPATETSRGIAVARSRPW